MNCECGGTGWVVTVAGATKCPCRDAKTNGGRRLIDSKSLAQAVDALSVLAFFPAGQPARTVIGEALSNMCPYIECLRYVVRRACSLYKTWDRCGLPGLRQIVCARYRPADGIESSGTEDYPEGLPSEDHPLRISGPERLELPPGHTASTDPEAESMIKQVAESTNFGQSRRMHHHQPSRREIAAAPEWLRKMEGYDA